jgi:hypothetical protein
LLDPLALGKHLAPRAGSAKTHVVLGGSSKRGVLKRELLRHLTCFITDLFGDLDQAINQPIS